MESAWVAAYLFQPIPVGVVLIFLFFATRLLVPASATFPTLTRKQAGWGFFGVFVASLIVSAWLSYVPKVEAEIVWKMLPENYWSAILNEFFITSILLSFLSLIGCALIGLPIIVAISRHGLDSTPIILCISIAISLSLTTLMEFLGIPSPEAQFISMAKEFVPTHAFLAFGFCIGAQLQWRLRQHHEA